MDAAEAVDDEHEEGDEEGGMLSGGKMMPVLAFRPPYASSSADEVELEEEALGHCPVPCPEAVPGRDDPPVPTMAYCSRPRPALEDGLLPAETADEPLMPEEEEGRKPLEY